MALVGRLDVIAHAGHGGAIVEIVVLVGMVALVAAVYLRHRGADADESTPIQRESSARGEEYEADKALPGKVDPL
jgi:hypothetical protein